jgi:hypothetical protein
MRMVLNFLDTSLCCPDVYDANKRKFPERRITDEQISERGHFVVAVLIIARNTISRSGSINFQQSWQFRDARYIGNVIRKANKMCSRNTACTMRYGLIINT